MSDGLRGFAELRTREAVPEVEPEPKRLCPKCGRTFLSRSNPGPLCRPCEFGHIEIPEWAEALLPEDADRALFNTLAAAIAPEHVTLRRPTVAEPIEVRAEAIPPDLPGLELRQIILREFGTLHACTEAMDWTQSIMHSYWTSDPRRLCRLPEWRRQLLNAEIARRRNQKGDGE